MIFVFALVFFLITGDIVAFIPVILHEIDAFIAGVVFVAVFAPMFGVILMYTQINGRAVSSRALDYDRLSINHAWCREFADVELPIEARLSDAY